MKKFLLKALGLGAVATAAVAAYAVIKNYMKDSACDDYNDDFEDDLQECCLTKDTCDYKKDEKPCESKNKEEAEAVKEDVAETSKETKEDAPTSETAE